MSQAMPMGQYRWLSTQEVTDFDIMHIDPLVDGDFGYILEVDLEYDESLHLLHRYEQHKK